MEPAVCKGGGATAGILDPAASSELLRTLRCAPPAVRKGYHALAVALFLPAAALEPALLGVSLAIAYALLAAVELARVVDAPVLGELWKLCTPVLGWAGFSNL